MIQSIVHCWPLLLSPIFRVAYESRVEKTGHLLRLSTNRSNFLLLHKTGSAGQPEIGNAIDFEANEINNEIISIILMKQKKVKIDIIDWHNAMIDD